MTVRPNWPALGCIGFCVAFWIAAPAFAVWLTRQGDVSLIAFVAICLAAIAASFAIRRPRKAIPNRPWPEGSRKLQSRKGARRGRTDR